MDKQLQVIDQLIKSAQKIVVLQADNPDGDSLASSLALEQILGELGKDVYLYCSIDMPNHLRHLDGWDRVLNVFASDYDLAIMVDNASDSLLQNLRNREQINLEKRPLIIIDHHATESTISYAAASVIDQTAVSTGQVIYRLAKQIGWKIDQASSSYLASSILSDTLGLTTDAMKGNSQVLRDLAELVDYGVDLAELHQKRLESLKYNRALVPYKGELLQRVEFSNEGTIASIVIPHDEIKEHSMKFNPTIILDELRMVEGVKVTLGF
ncbi:DHH family phosphoesterase, partial [Candidatus Saccharibacteria bacterium]|nr:DHH family phosphoesterase [Candidatus Saccharibacteria bacterium]